MAEEFEEHASKLDLKSLVITMILSALGFLVALTWRDAIQQSIDLFIPKGEGLYYTYLAAIVITITAVVITFVLIKIKNRNIIPDSIEERIKSGVKKGIKRRGNKNSGEE